MTDGKLFDYPRGDKLLDDGNGILPIANTGKHGDDAINSIYIHNEKTQYE